MGNADDKSPSPPSPSPEVKAVMDGIPFATRRDFPSNRARGVITADPEAVTKAKAVYKKESVEGTLKLYKQAITNMDQMTMKKNVKVIENHWNVDELLFRSFKMFIASTTEEGWNYKGNVVEELEHNQSGTEYLFFHVIRNWYYGKYYYSLAICHLKSDKPLYNEVLIAGMIMEGLLGKDEEQRLYLQF